MFILKGIRMKRTLIFVSVMATLLIIQSVSAGPTLPNTGEAGAGVVETNYTLTYAENLGDTPVVMTVYGLETPPYWVDAPPDTHWLSIGNSPEAIYWGAPVGYYFFELNFEIPGITSISGEWATDNDAEIFLNGASTGNTKGLWGFQSLDTFSITSGFTGNDTLVFRVFNEGAPTGLLVTNMTVTVIPLPSTILLGSIGVGCVGWLRKKRKLV
jgi:hypothetical protein